MATHEKGTWVNLAKIEVGDEKFVLPATFKEIASDIQNLPVFDDDIFVGGFYSTGTTWVQELVWCLKYGISFDLSKPLKMNVKFPLLEMCMYPIKHNLNPIMWDSINCINAMNNGRLIKTRLPWTLLPKQIITNEKKPKIIYIYRNPKDACVSLYFHLKSVGAFKGTLSEYCEEILNDKETFCPFWKHIEGYLNQKHLPNLLILTYEEMKRNLRKVITLTARFLSIPINEEQMSVLEQHLSFATMYNNRVLYTMDFEPISYCPLRIGQTSDYKKHMSPELVARFDDWTMKSRLVFRRESQKPEEEQ